MLVLCLISTNLGLFSKADCTCDGEMILSVYEVLFSKFLYDEINFVTHS